MCVRARVAKRQSVRERERERAERHTETDWRLCAVSEMAAASGRLALKARSAVSAGDINLAETAAAGLAAAAAPASATAGTYNFDAIGRATNTLPAVPPRHSVGRPANQPLAPVFNRGSARARVTSSSSTRPRGRGRVAKPPASGSGKRSYHCERCDGQFASLRAVRRPDS